jgi:hypothetical protein
MFTMVNWENYISFPGSESEDSEEELDDLRSYVKEHLALMENVPGFVSALCVQVNYSKMSLLEWCIDNIDWEMALLSLSFGADPAKNMFCGNFEEDGPNEDDLHPGWQATGKGVKRGIEGLRSLITRGRRGYRRTLLTMFFVDLMESCLAVVPCELNPRNDYQQVICALGAFEAFSGTQGGETILSTLRSNVKMTLL